MKAAANMSRRDEVVASLKSDMGLMKWMMGFVLPFQAATFVKLFVH